MSQRSGCPKHCEGGCEDTRRNGESFKADRSLDDDRVAKTVHPEGMVKENEWQELR